MKEIIKKGKKPQYKMKFRCSKCGCEFLAEKRDVIPVHHENFLAAYACVCPCCGDTCYHSGVYSTADEI